MAVEFLMLLTLTDKGRVKSTLAAKCLEDAQDALGKKGEVGGKCYKALWTYGQFDSAIVGVCPTEGALAGLATWISNQGYFSTQTLLGVEPESIVPTSHKN